MSEFKKYVKSGIAEMRPITENDIASYEKNNYINSINGFIVSISDVDKENNSPKIGDMIARNPKDYTDQWLVSKEYFETNYDTTPLSFESSPVITKTLGNTTASQAKENVKDIVFWGNGDTFKLISKASSQSEGWMKSTKAMEISGVGCVIQVTTQQGDNVSEAVTFVPNTYINEELDDSGTVVSRTIEGLA